MRYPSGRMSTLCTGGGTDDGSRDSVGGATSVSYRNDAVRNNILEVRPTNDAENLYVMIRTENDIVTAEDTGWMNLFIGCGRPATGKGWKGYEYAVNRSRTDGRATVEAMNADGTGTRIGEVSYTVQKNVMQIAIPRALIGADGMGDIYFKVADGVENPCRDHELLCLRAVIAHGAAELSVPVRAGLKTFLTLQKKEKQP